MTGSGRWPRYARRLVALVVLGIIAVLGGQRAWRWFTHHHHRLQLPIARWLDLRERGHKPVPTVAERQAGFLVFRRSILERVYPTSSPRPGERDAAATVHAARGQYEALQLAVYPLRDLHRLQVQVSDLTDADGDILPAPSVVVRMVRYYGVSLSQRLHNRFGIVPKTLEIAVPLDAHPAAVRPYWITVRVPEEQPGGVYTGTITFTHDSGTLSVPFTVDVVPVRLDEPDAMYGTLCTSALGNVWKRQRTADVLRTANLMFRDQRAHGMTMLSLRSSGHYQMRDGHPALEDLDAAMDFYRRYGFRQPLVYCAGRLFKTDKINRSGNYREHDPTVHVPLARAVGAYYTEAFRDAGLPGVAFIAVEEPNLKSGIAPADPPDIRQRLAHDLTHALKEAGAVTAMACTPESVRSAIDDLDYWIVAFKRFTPAVYDMARTAHAQLGLYANAAMMGQGTYFTRFMYGYFSWANHLRAMVAWTYPMQPKRFPRNLGHGAEGGLNVRDGFLGIDGNPIPTIQWELSREGIDDVRYLVTIERLARTARVGGDAAHLAAAEDAERFLDGLRHSVGNDPQHYLFENPRTLEPQAVDDWTTARFEATRQQAVELLKTLVQ